MEGPPERTSCQPRSGPLRSGPWTQITKAAREAAATSTEESSGATCHDRIRLLSESVRALLRPLSQMIVGALLRPLSQMPVLLRLAEQMTAGGHLRDRELLRRARLGDCEAFDAFRGAHRGAVLAFFRVRVRSAGLAADLTCETFTRALAALRDEERELPAVPITWLLTIARRALPLDDAEMSVAARQA